MVDIDVIDSDIVNLRPLLQCVGLMRVRKCGTCNTESHRGVTEVRTYITCAVTDFNSFYDKRCNQGLIQVYGIILMKNTHSYTVVQ